MHAEYIFSIDEALLNSIHYGISLRKIISYAENEFKKYGDYHITHKQISIKRKGYNECKFILCDNSDTYIISSCINVQFDSCECDYHRVLNISHSNHGIKLKYFKIIRKKGEAIFPHIVIQSQHTLKLGCMGGRRYASSGPEYEYIHPSKTKDTIEAFIVASMKTSTLKEQIKYYET